MVIPLSLSLPPWQVMTLFSWDASEVVFNSLPGQGVIFSVVVRDPLLNTSASYVPVHTYACSFDSAVDGCYTLGEGNQSDPTPPHLKPSPFVFSNCPGEPNPGTNGSCVSESRLVMNSCRLHPSSFYSHGILSSQSLNTRLQTSFNHKTDLIFLNPSLHSDRTSRQGFHQGSVHHGGSGRPVCLLLWPPLLQVG